MVKNKKQITVLKRASQKASKRTVSAGRPKFGSINSVWLKIGIAAVVVIVLVAFGLVYNLSTVGQAINKPSPAVDLTLKSSEYLYLSSYDNMEVKIKGSAGGTTNYVLKVEKFDDKVYYTFTLKNDPNEVLASGYLSDEFTNAGEIYLDADEKADIQIYGNLDYVAIYNLEFAEPAVSDVVAYSYDAVSNKSKKIEDNILYVDLGNETKFIFNVSSTSKPTVKATLDGQIIELKEENSGKDFVSLSFIFNGNVTRPAKLVISSDVKGKTSEADYIVAFGGMIYRLADEKFPEISLKRDLQSQQEKYTAAYTFRKTQNLQPIALLCGSIPVNTIVGLTDSVDKIMSFGQEIEQWTASAPSDFGNLVSDKGYIFQLKKNVELSFNVTCGKLPAENIGALNAGWNLIGVSDYQPVEVEKLKVKPGKGKIGSIQDINKFVWSEGLKPGMVYWIKVG